MTQELLLHASCVALDGRGVLILGPSGAGKSALALGLMAHGAVLCADDRTRIWREEERLCAAAPAAIAGLIEARGFGLLPAAAAACRRLVLAVDLGAAETERLPEPQAITLLGCALPLRRAQGVPNLAPAILQWLRWEGAP